MRLWGYLSANLATTFSKSSSFTLSECIDSTAKLDNLSSSIVVLKCVLISLRQLTDLSDATDVTGIVQAICRSLLSSLKTSSYIEKIAEIKERRSILAKYWHSIVSCFALDPTLHLFQLSTLALNRRHMTCRPYCSANFLMELYSIKLPEPGVRVPMPHIMLMLAQSLPKWAFRARFAFALKLPELLNTNVANR